MTEQPSTSKPFAGIRVVEAAQMISAPLAGAILAEQGADVVKVELADGVGDRLRAIGSRRDDISAVFNGVNHGKRSVTFDTKTEAGLEALLALCATADVFLQNFRPGAAERMGVGEAQLRSINPDIIYVSVSGFGSSGPKVDQKVYDYVIQAMTGIASLQGLGSGGGSKPDKPQLIRQFVIDKVTALTVSQAITAALFARERGLGGQHVELAMLDVGLWFFWPDGMMDRSLLSDDVHHSPHFSLAYDVVATRDGFIAMIPNGNRSWPPLCQAFNPSWLTDARYATPEDREANQAELSADFAAVVGDLTTTEALERMRANDVPGAAVVDLDNVAGDEQIAHNETLAHLLDGPAGERLEALPPVKFGGGRAVAPTSAPSLGANTDEVLTELGYTADSIANMRESGVLGP